MSGLQVAIYKFQGSTPPPSLFIIVFSCFSRFTIDFDAFSQISRDFNRFSCISGYGCQSVTRKARNMWNLWFVITSKYRIGKFHSGSAELRSHAGKTTIFEVAPKNKNARFPPILSWWAAIRPPRRMPDCSGSRARPFRKAKKNTRLANHHAQDVVVLQKLAKSNTEREPFGVVLITKTARSCDKCGHRSYHSQQLGKQSVFDGPGAQTS